MSLEAALDTVAPRPKPTAPPTTQRKLGQPATEQVAGLVRLRVGFEIKTNPGNPRERMTEIEELAASIHENGLIQPIIVRPDTAGGYVIVAGHRRYEAVQRLGWLHVEAIVRKEMRAIDDLVAALVENGQRAGLDPIEEARALHALKVRSHLSDAEIAKKVGRSQPIVSGRIALLSLSPAEQEEIRAGQMRLGEATNLARVNAGTKRAKVAGDSRGWHIGPSHPLAARAKVRCQQKGHKVGRGIGGVAACGQCWEGVIRLDERQLMHREAATAGECPICDGPYGTPTP